MSASAWHGCSSSVSALTTCMRGAAAANSRQPRLRERADDGARRPSARGCARRRRRSRGRRAPRPRGGSMTSPPSSRTAIVKVDRVRSDGFSKSSATCRPASGRAGVAAGRAGAASAPPRAPARRRARPARGRAPTESPWSRAPGSARSSAGDSQGPAHVPILRVDAHVLGAEIAGPHGRLRAGRRRRGRRCSVTSRPCRARAAAAGALVVRHARHEERRRRRSATDARSRTNGAPERPAAAIEPAPVRDRRRGWPS